LAETKFKTIAQNKKAYHEYFIIEKYECGIELFGTEVKSIRQGSINLKDSYCSIDKSYQLSVLGMHISPYEKGNIFNKDPLRKRKLLMHKREIIKLWQKVQQDGLTLIPLSVYLKGNLIKIELGLCKGKKLHDKRQSDAERSIKRELDKTLKEHNKF